MPTIEQELLSFYRSLLTEPQADRMEAIQKITQHIPKLVTSAHNDSLMRTITMEEVGQAVMEMPAGKSPGPDGFTTDFFHSCWPIIKQEVWELVEDTRRTSGVLSAFNSAFLTLIPKEDGANNPNKFRPIALCNVIYKIITKVIANRLKPLMPNLTSQEQSRYVEGQKILDGIILAHEVIHSLKSSKKVGMLMKLDM